MILVFHIRLITYFVSVKRNYMCSVRFKLIIFFFRVMYYLIVFKTLKKKKFYSLSFWSLKLYAVYYTYILIVDNGEQQNVVCYSVLCKQRTILDLVIVLMFPISPYTIINYCLAHQTHTIKRSVYVDSPATRYSP